MLVMLTIITPLLTSKFSATNCLCIQNVSNFTIGLRDRIAGVLMPMGGANTADMHKLDCTVGNSRLIIL